MFVEKQRKNAEFLTNAIKRLVLSFLDGEELALVAAVNGEATDLGVSMLPLLAASLPRTRPRSVPLTDTTNDRETLETLICLLCSCQGAVSNTATKQDPPLIF
ncbi:Hypothetical protein FKW44_019853 [Caligus rogercresseyi]|uniref:Uncharacterized protein n=1 Tax=Caligus rogercresseyi TaxID=217165 RepID=A0A7T8JYF9_CALRO|nr:Hypothetical protein FKW44_019853 [Caligus rogercresseyi]